MMVRISLILLGHFSVLMRDCLGTHPEMLRTFFELDKRRDRRATHSEAKRKREIELAVDVRQADEDYVWLGGRYGFLFWTFSS